MTFRRTMQWLVRVVILATIVCFFGAVWYAQTWVSPEQVRTAVIEALSEQFPGCEVQVQSARLSVFGGVTVSDFQVTRNGDKQPFFVAPSVVIAHDKEGLNHGRLAIRKVELERPTIRIVRGEDGRWQLPEFQQQLTSGHPIPTFVIRDALVIVSDLRPNALPEVRIEQAKLQFVNDPLPVVKIQGQAQVAPFGTIIISVQRNLETRRVAVRVEMPEIVVNPALASGLAKWKPDAPQMLAGVTGSIGIKADVTYMPEDPKPIRSEVKVEIKNGRFVDESLPAPIEQIQTEFVLSDGKLTVEKAMARMGHTSVELSCETDRISALAAERWFPGLSTSTGFVSEPMPASFEAFEERLLKLNAVVKQVALNDPLLSRLSPRADVVRNVFQPQGSVDVHYQFARAAQGWKKEIDVKPNRIEVAFEKFPLPVKELDGSIRKTITSDGRVESDVVAIRLTGQVQGKRVEFLGQVVGQGDDPSIDLRISGIDLNLDDHVFAAIPQEKARKFLRSLRASGRGDFVASVHKSFGMNRFETIVTIDAKDGRMNFERFPYPIESITGKVVIKVISSDKDRPNAPGTFKPTDPNPDRVELIGFTGKHGNGLVWLDGSIEEVPQSRDQSCVLKIKAKDCPLDDSFAKSMDAIRFGEVHRMFHPTGAITLGMNLSILDRANVEFDAERDLVLAVNFKGPTAKPAFLPYEMTDVNGAFRYQNRRVELIDFTATHGPSRLSMDVGEVRLRDDGTIWTNLERLAITPVVVDDDLIAALPKTLQQPLRNAKPQGTIELQMKKLVVLVPTLNSKNVPEPEPLTTLTTSPIVARGQSAGEPKYGAPIMYWDGQIKLAGASIEAGASINDLIGTVACRGRYDGDHLTGLVGNLWFDSASVFKQPMGKVKGSFAADAQIADKANPGQFSPIKVRVTDLQGKLFRGDITGEAQLVLAEPPQYRMAFSVNDVRLEEFASHHQLGKESELTGIAQAKLYLEQEPDPKTGLSEMQGTGSIDVPMGRMYKLPVLLELVKLSKLHAPDQTGFEEAHATFRIRGDRVFVDKIDLLGNAISLGGSGELDIHAQDVKFEFYTIWSQTLKRWLTTPLGDPTSALSEKLFRIDAARTNGGDFKYTPRMVPIVTDPFRAVADRVKQRMGLTPDPVIRAVGVP